MLSLPLLELVGAMVGFSSHCKGGRLDEKPRQAKDIAHVGVGGVCVCVSSFLEGGDMRTCVVPSKSEQLILVLYTNNNLCTAFWLFMKNK